MSQFDPQTADLLEQFKQKHSQLGSIQGGPTTGSGPSTMDLMDQFKKKYQPGGSTSFVDQMPSELGTYMAGQGGTISEAISGQRYGGHDIDLTARPQDADQALAGTLATIKGTPGLYPDFAQKPWEQQVEIANRVNPQNFQTNPQVQAQQAAARMYAAHQGQYTYQSPEEQASDLQILAQSNLATRGQLQAGRAKSGGMAASFGAGAADAATGGLGGVVRNIATPETTGFEQAAYTENPWSARAGVLAGSFIPMAGAGKAGGAIAGAAATKLFGEAAAGPVAQGITRIAGGLAGQEVGMAGTAAGQAVSAGGGGKEALQAAGQSLTMLPELAMKLGRGDDLTEDDVVNLAMLVPMYSGLRGEFGHVMKEYRASPAGKRAALGRSLMNDIQQAPTETPQGGPRITEPSLYAGEAIAKQAEPTFDNMAATEGSTIQPQYAPDAPSARRRYSGAELDQQAGQQFPDLVQPNGPGMAPEQVRAWEAQQADLAQTEAAQPSAGGGPTTAGEGGGGFDTSGFRVKPKDEHLAAIKARLDAGENPSIREVARMLGSPNDIRRAKRAIEAVRKTRGEPQVSADTSESAAKTVTEPAAGGKEIGTGQQTVDPNDPRITANKITNVQEAAVQRWMGQDPATWPEIVGHKKPDGTIEFGDGNHRMEAARRMGLKELPITVLGEGERAAPSTPKAAEGLHNTISEVQNAMGGVDTDKMSPEMQQHFFGKVEEGMTYGEAKSRITGETTGSAEAAPPRSNIDRARSLFEPTEHVSPAKIKAELGVSMKESIELAGQLKKERRPTRESKGDKPLPAGSPERTISRDEVMRQVQKDHPASAEVTRAMLESQKGDYVERDVPLDKIDLENIRQEAKAGQSGINPGKIRRYAAEEGAAPPVVGVESPNEKGKLFVADGRHRVLAQALRDKESGKAGTVRAHVPAEWAREHLDQPAKPALPEGVTHNGPQKNRAGEVVYDTYTDSKTKTSFSVRPGELVEARLEEARKRMAPKEETAAEVDASPVKAKIAARQQFQAATDPVSPQGIIAKLHADLGLGLPGLGKSRVLKTKALGWIMPSPEHIRLRLADDMDTAIHEIGHYLHKLVFQENKSYNPATGKRLFKTGLIPDVFPKTWMPELDALGQKLYGSRKPASGYASEGWAELTRLIFTDPAEAKKAAPTAYPEAMKILTSKYPEQYASLLQFRKAYDTYAKANPMTKLMGYIREKPAELPWIANGANEPLKNWLTKQYDRWNMMLFDQTAAVGAMARELGGRASGKMGEFTKDRLEDAKTSALRMRGKSYGDFDVAVRRGRFDPVTRQTTGPGLAEVLAPVRDNINEWQSYMAGKRALEKRKQGFKNIFPGLTDTDIATAVTLAEHIYPEFKKVAKGFQDFNEWLIRDYAVKSGLITPAAAEKIIAKNLDYITFAAVKSEVQPDVSHSGGPPKKMTETGTGIKRFPKNLEGAYIEPPIHAFMASMEGIMTRAATNGVAREITMLEQSEGAGRWFRRIDRPLDASIIRSGEIVDEISRRLKASGVAGLDDPTLQAIGDLIQQDDFKSFHAGFRVSPKTGEFSVLTQGKPQFYEAVHPFLKEFLQGKHSPAALGQAWQWLRIPRNIYRAGTTAKSVGFFTMNFMRDFVHAALFSEGRGGGKDAVIARTSAKWGGILKAIKSGDPGALYELSGASQSGLFQEYIDKKTGRFNLDRMFEKPGRLFSPQAEAIKHPSMATISKAIKDVMTLEPVARINERLELANRMGAFQTALIQGDINRTGVARPSKAQIEMAALNRPARDIFFAGQAAADSTLDFQRGGKATVSINQGIPFFNAAFLGGNKLYRFAKEHPVEFAVRTMEYVVGPSLISMAMNRNNDKYWNIPYEQRDRYWHFPTGDYNGDGGGFIKIPKPYGIGIVANFIERAYASEFGIDPITGKQGDPHAFRNFGGGVVDQFRPPYTIPVATAAFELMANHSLFFGGPIVRKAEQVGPPGERGAERSSQVARALGGLMDIPPPMIDYAISGVTGTLGKDVTQYVADPLVRVVREDVMGKAPLTHRESRTMMETLPVIKQMVLEDPKTNSETMIRFWNAYENADNSFRGYTQRVSSGAKDTKEYYQAHRAEIDGYYNIQPFKENLSELFKELTGVYRNDKLSETERYQQSTKIIKDIHVQARDGLKNLDRATKESK